MSAAPLAYQSGFGNQFATEAQPGALPQGRNSPQRAAHGLYAELVSGSAFTAPRADNRRSWLYRRQPSVVSGRHQAYAQPLWTTGAAGGVAVPPDPLRWHPFAPVDGAHDFIAGLRTVCANGDADAQLGMAALVYSCNQAMGRRALVNADGELLLVPQQGRLRITTELGPIGSNGLANPRDFLAPVAAYQADDAASGPWQIVRKFGGRLWANQQPGTPFNVVAWHGNLTPVKYDTAHFMAIGSISFDHPDPSIFTVLTSPSDTPGTANCDFVIFPPRWMVAEDTFRPPWYHRNLMAEFMGLVHGQYDAKPEGFRPGGASLHNTMVPHGPDAEAFAKASAAPLAPHKLDHTLAFMFESRYRLVPTAWAMGGGQLDTTYAACWAGLHDTFKA